MLTKETIKLGEAFARLLDNPDYKELQKFIQTEIQTASSVLLQPKPPNKTIEQWAIDSTNLQGQLIGMALADSYMEDIVKLMEKAKKQKEEEKKLG